MSSDLFLKIIKGEIPSTKVYEDDYVYAFKDLHPQASLHYLFVAKVHTTNINEMSEKQPEQLAQIFNAIREFTIDNGLDKTGFRVVANTNSDAGQTVFHTHFHVLAGEKLRTFGR